MSLDALKDELHELELRFPHLSPDALFSLWFVHAYLVDDENIAATSVVGAPNDKGIDAVYIDDGARIAFVIQTKFRHSVGRHPEKRADVTSFAELGPLLWEGGDRYEEFCQGMDPLVRRRLDEVRSRLRRREHYRLQLDYVTLGRCSADVRRDAEQCVRRAAGPTEFVAINGREVLGILRDYLDGVAPPVPSLDLPVETGGKIKTSGVVTRYDPDSQIESWVFSMTGSDVAELFERAGVRLFARNIRGFLGSTRINAAMEDTLSHRPSYFWYFNNGVTIVCDGATRVQEKGREIVRLEGPQVINGQQTTRVLAMHGRLAPKASVLVRVIRIPRGVDGADRFDELVSRVVEATNSQNHINASDLVANDRRQVQLERDLRKLGYQYLRKRQTKGEARRAAGARFRFVIKKEELAQAVAATKFDPLLVRQGKEGLFEEQNYPLIFDSASADDYLSRYWLMRRVSVASRGYPEWAYAKWVVLHFLWDEVGSDIKRYARKWRTACERPNSSDRVLNPLNSATQAVFLASLAFYRANRGGPGPGAIDVSTFFKRKDLHKEFGKFWATSAPQTRTRQFDRGARRFRAELERASG